MSLDLTTLQLLKHRDKHDRYIGAVPATALSTQTQIILKDFGRWFREFDGATEIDLGLFPFWFKSVHPGLKPEAVAVFDELFKRVKPDVPEHIEGGLGKRWVAADTASKVTTLLEQWNSGEEVDIGRMLKEHVEAYEQRVEKRVKNPQVLDPIEDLLKAEENETGLKFRLPCLNRHVKPLVGGDFIIVAARPDTGKTSFCASELTHMAAQLDDIYPGEGRSILHLNNEGPGKKIVMRNFQAAIGATVEELVALSNKPSNNQAYKTAVREHYAQALGGRMGSLRVFDIHGMWNHEVEDLIRLYKPAVVLFDMIDNIKFGGEIGNGGQRTDQVLEGMYQWGRLLAVKYDCVIIATSQVSADGDGLQYPTLPMLKDSKTGKQGAADLIITIGKVNDPMLANSRYIGVTKSKKVKTGSRSSPNCEVLFQPDISRYTEMPV